METARLLIRRFSSDDWRDMFEYLSQESVVKHEPYDVFTEDGCKQEAVRRARDDSFLAVCLKDSGKLIGNIYFAKQDFDTWELGYVFNENYQGMGYATEAVYAIVDDAFLSGCVRRIIARCNPLNEPSWKLLERLGMCREGHLNRNIFFKKDGNGKPIWQDTYEYGILAAEWFCRTL